MSKISKVLNEIKVVLSICKVLKPIMMSSTLLLL